MITRSWRKEKNRAKDRENEGKNT